MTIFHEIQARLTGYAGLAALVDDRIYQNHVPDGQEVWPAVTWMSVDITPLTTNVADPALRPLRLQVDVWFAGDGNGIATVQAVRNQVQAALDRWSTSSGTIVQQSFLDLVGPIVWETDSLKYHGIIEFIVWFEES